MAPSGPPPDGGLPTFAARVASLFGSPIDALDARVAGRTGLVPLAGGTPRAADLPVSQLAQVAAQAIEADPRVLNYGPAQGDDALLEQLAALTERVEGVRPAQAELVVTSGATQALDLIARLFLDRGDLVVVEAPTYSDVLSTFSAYGPDVVAVPLDEEGISLDGIRAAVKRAGRAPRLIYVIPTFQNPSGGEMSRERRLGLLELADSYGSLVVDDDPYRLLRYSGEHGASLYALADGRPNVVATRSASKLVAPGLRIGWLAGDPRLIAAVAQAKSAADLSTSRLSQRVVAEFLGRGLLDARIEHLVTEYAARLEAFGDALGDAFAGTGVSWRTPAGGYFLWVSLDRGVTAERMLTEALEEGVSFVPGSAFSPAGEFPSALRLCFVTCEPDVLREGALRLRRAFDRALSGV
jgi:2-aminoadipate transaminase